MIGKAVLKLKATWSQALLNSKLLGMGAENQWQGPV